VRIIFIQNDFERGVSVGTGIRMDCIDREYATDDYWYGIDLSHQPRRQSTPRPSQGTGPDGRLHDDPHRRIPRDGSIRTLQPATITSIADPGPS
jgi:hypothetical protein